MKIQEYILILVCYACSGFGIYSAFTIKLFKNESYTLTQGVAIDIIPYGSKTEFYLQNENRIVYETTSLTNHYLNTSDKHPFERNALYKIGSIEYDSWKKENDLGYHRREIITLSKNKDAILTIDDYNEAEKSNGMSGLSLAGVFLILGVILHLAFSNKEKIIQWHTNKTLRKLESIPGFKDGILTSGQHKIRINPVFKLLEVSKYGNHNFIEILIPISHYKSTIKNKIAFRYETTNLDGEVFVRLIYTMYWTLNVEKFQEWLASEIARFDKIHLPQVIANQG